MEKDLVPQDDKQSKNFNSEHFFFKIFDIVLGTLATQQGKTATIVIEKHYRKEDTKLLFTCKDMTAHVKISTN